MLALPTSYTECRRTRGDRYFTGKPCRRGHVAARFAWGGCTECCQERDAARDKHALAEEARARRSANPKLHRIAVQRFKANNPEKVRSWLEEWKQKNADRITAYQKWYCELHGERLKTQRRINRHFEIWLRQLALEEKHVSAEAQQ